MRLLVFKVFVFAIINVLLLYAHILLFQSSFPFSSWASLACHGAALLFFPYEKAFKMNPKKNKPKQKPKLK